MTMPVMQGDEAYRLIRKIDSDVKIVICSGYSQDEIEHRFDEHQSLVFVSKPYRPEALIAAMQGL